MATDVTPEQLLDDAAYLEFQAELSSFPRLRMLRIAAYLRASCPMSVAEELAKALSVRSPLNPAHRALAPYREDRSE